MLWYNKNRYFPRPLHPTGHIFILWDKNGNLAIRLQCLTISMFSILTETGRSTERHSSCGILGNVSGSNTWKSFGPTRLNSTFIMRIINIHISCCVMLVDDGLGRHKFTIALEGFVAYGIQGCAISPQGEWEDQAADLPADAEGCRKRGRDRKDQSCDWYACDFTKHK